MKGIGERNERADSKYEMVREEGFEKLEIK